MNEEGIKEVTDMISDKVKKEADKKCRNSCKEEDEKVGDESGCEEKEESVTHITEKQHLGAQPPEKSGKF